MGGFNAKLMRTFEEICEELIKTDEITLLEQLEITSEDIVERFKDYIETRLTFFQMDFEDEDTEDMGE